MDAASTASSCSPGPGLNERRPRCWIGARFRRFTRVGTTWSQQAYIKASNTDVNDVFGYSVALSADGRALAVGAIGEDSAATGINGDQGNTVFSCGGRSGNGATFIEDPELPIAEPEWQIKGLLRD